MSRAAIPPNNGTRLLDHDCVTRPLIAKIDAVRTSPDKETVLTLDEYFDGNTTEEYSTLCANTGKSPSAEELWRLLRGIEDKTEVSQVLVRVSDYDDAREYGDLLGLILTRFYLTLLKANKKLKEVSTEYYILSPDIDIDQAVHDLDSRGVVVEIYGRPSLANQSLSASGQSRQS
jgi:hypothetical protein